MNDLTVQATDRRKRELKRVRRNNELIKRLARKLDVVNQRIYTLKSPEVSGMPRGGDPVTLPDLIADKADLEARIKRLSEKGRRYRTEILEEIDELDIDPKCVEVIELFLVDCNDFAEIAEIVGYSERQVQRYYKTAMTALLSL